MTPLLAALSAICLLAGFVTLAAGLHRVPVDTAKPPPTWRHRFRKAAGKTSTQRRRRAVLVGAALAGAMVWLATGWALAVIIAPAAAMGLPILLQTSSVAAENARVEAIGQWTGELAAVIRAGGGIEQTIADSLNTTPASIRDEVGRLVSRLRAGWDTTAALRALADDFACHTGDKVAVALILGTRRRGPRLASFLTNLATSVAKDVAAHRAIDAQHAKDRSTARIVTVISTAVITLLLLTPHAEFYRTVTGEFALLILLGLYATCLVLLKRMTTPPPLPRLFTAAKPNQPELV